MPEQLEESPDSEGQATEEISAGATPGKCHREQTADGPGPQARDQARVKRRCKRPPAARATGPARQTLVGARPNRKAHEGCPSEPSGRPHRWMSSHDRIRLIGPLSSIDHNMTRNRTTWTLLLVGYAGIIFALSSLPLGEGPAPLSFPGRDWVLHAFEFGLFFVLARKAIGRTSIALLVTALYAGSDEFHQMFVPARDANLTDLGFDLLGACVAAAAAVARRNLLPAKIARRILGVRSSGKEKGS